MLVKKEVCVVREVVVVAGLSNEEVSFSSVGEDGGWNKVANFCK